MPPLLPQPLGVFEYANPKFHVAPKGLLEEDCRVGEAPESISRVMILLGVRRPRAAVKPYAMNQKPLEIVDGGQCLLRLDIGSGPDFLVAQRLLLAAIVLELPFTALLGLDPPDRQRDACT